MRATEVAVLGGGIVGLATAYQIQRLAPGVRVAVVEKEEELGLHQTGHNSGVLHSGVYYRPGSRKARNCARGKAALEDFCRREGLPFRITGKVIVAVDAEEEERLWEIHRRGLENGVDCELVDPRRLRELEPAAAGVGALHVPGAGIVDFRQVARRLGERVEEAGGEILTGAQVEGLRSGGRGVAVETGRGTLDATLAVNCCGLFSDRVARLAGSPPAARIVPFRGEYYELVPGARHLCRGLIYPVPDPRFPFLGVHFTRTLDGGVECGPNAVLALAREGYRRRDLSLRDLAETLTYPGFLRLAGRYWRVGLGELWRSWSKAAFTRALRRLVPALRLQDLEPAPAGVRAQAVRPEGSLEDDFLIQEDELAVHVTSAPSPAATSCLAIGEEVAGMALRRLSREARPGFRR